MRDVLTRRQHRHDFGWLPGHSKQVPLLSTGETHRGFFRVPESAVTFSPHSNKVHKYDQRVVQKVREWVAWKRKQGWFIRGKPRVLAPIPGPSVRFGAEPMDEGDMRVYVEATFYREKPIHVPLDAFLHRMDEARRYGVAAPRARQVENPLPTPARHITDGEVVDPMRAAEKRRASLGLRRVVNVKDGVLEDASVEAHGGADAPDER